MIYLRILHSVHNGSDIKYDGIYRTVQGNYQSSQFREVLILHIIILHINYVSYL